MCKSRPTNLDIMESIRCALSNAAIGIAQSAWTMELESSAVFERHARKVRARQRALSPQLQLQHFLLQPDHHSHVESRVSSCFRKEIVRNQLCCETRRDRHARDKGEDGAKVEEERDERAEGIR